MVRGFVCLAFAAGVSSVAFGYEDDYITTADDSVVFKEVGDRKVYVFTNTAAAATLTFRQKMTLEEALVVGGGGAGGGFHGGGGGGGGVLDLTARTFCPEAAQISLTVGKGGAGNGNGVGKPGSPSSVTIGGVTSTARGGGGGGCGTSSLPSTGSNGSGGGAGCPNGSGAASVLASSDEYTSGQGNPGGNNPGKAKAGGGGGYSERGHDGAAFSVSEDKSVTGICGDGGEGLTNAITGVEVVYGSGGGGGGGTSNFGTTWAGKGGTNAGDGGAGRLSQNPDAASNLATVDGHAAPAGFGGGGGGGGACKEGSYSGSAQRRNGGAGGSGTVILAFSVGGEPGKPVIAQENVNFTFPDGESQPYFDITLTGAEGAAYSATVKVYCGTGALAQADEVYQSTNSFDGIANGGSVEGFAFVYPRPDETFFVKVVASAESVEDTVFTTTVTVPSDCRVPSHVGKGGGAGVIHVRPGARGRGTGANWSDAYTDFRAALKEISAERPELWFCGDEGMNSAMTVTVAPPVAAAIRGGFVGLENASGERAKGAKSRIDGEAVYNCLTVDNAQELTVDGFLFTRGANNGLVKTGAGDIMVTNCTFDLNGFNGNRIYGRAMNLQGAAATTKATVVDCHVANHYELCPNNPCGTGAIYLQNLVSAVVAECVFVSNGMQHAYSGYGSSSGSPARFGAGGAAISTLVPTVILRSQFRANFGPSSDGDPISTGIVRFNAGSGGSEIRNCVFAGNENINSRNVVGSDLYGGTVAVMMSAQTDALLIDGCTFAYNVYDGHGSTAGINVKTGTVTLRNSIFHGNLATNSKKTYNAGTVPADILVHDGATLRATYTMFDPVQVGVSDQRADADGTLEIGTGCVYLDPLLVTSIDDISIYCGKTTKVFQPQYMDELCGIDCHLLSTVGYFTNGGAWVTTGTVNSPAIDKGDPNDSVGDEPEPNGGIVNMGAYGGTAEASMTSMVTPEFDGPVAISFLGETSQPKISFKLGGSTPYTADADVFISTDGSTWTKVGDTLFGRANDGTTYEVVVKVCYEKGATLYAKVELTTSAQKTPVVGTVPEGVEVTYDKHPSWGKGGGAGVIHVRPGATGDGSGSDWFNAIVDLGAAIRQIDEDRREVWCAGEWPTGATVSGPINPQVPAAIRGGFGGTELTAGERVSGARTLLDGNGESDCMAVQNATNLTIDGFCFTRGKARGLTKSGVGDITVTNCTFDANGAVTQKVSGRAMNLQGTAGVTHAVIADCRVVNHIETGSDTSKNGGAIYLGKLADATVSDCQFASNGVAYGTAPYGSTAAGRHSYWGGALAVQDVPVTVERCDFRGNQMPTSNISEGHSGGIVVLRGACGGSVLRNCVWAGNQNQHEQVATTYMSKKSGALVVDLADPAATARVENCTFVRNLFEGLDGTAGLNVCAGTVLVKDSIFHGNVCCANNTSNTVDILVRAGATANVTYTMVDSRADSRCDEGGTLDLGVGILEDDPRFVTSFADLGAHITSNGTQRIFKPVNQGKLVAFDCHVRPKSPAVDAGDPKSPYRNEPRPCGWRVNLGAYGNTSQATTSPAGTALIVR